MKQLTIIIRPEKLEEVKNALAASGYPGLTVTEVKGRGVQRGVTFEWRAGDYRVDLLAKLKLEIVIKDEDEESVINTIIAAAKTGEVGDGKIFVSTITEAVRIRTGDRGEGAL